MSNTNFIKLTAISLLLFCMFIFCLAVTTIVTVQLFNPFKCGVSTNDILYFTNEYGFYARSGGTLFKYALDSQTAIFNVSQDGNRISYLTSQGADVNYHLINQFGEELSNVSMHGYVVSAQTLSPLGDKIAFVVYENTSLSGLSWLYVMNVDGTRLRALIELDSDISPLEIEWSPNGDFVLFNFGNGERSYIYMVGIEEPFVRNISTSRFSGSMSWSPNGRYISYYAMSSRGINSYGEVVIWDLQTDITTAIYQGYTVRRSTGWSSDSTQIAFMTNDQNYDSGIASYNIVTEDVSILVDRPDISESSPVWSVDNTRVAFTAIDDNFAMNIYAVNVETLQICVLAYNASEPIWR